MRTYMLEKSKINLKNNDKIIGELSEISIINDRTKGYYGKFHRGILFNDCLDNLDRFLNVYIRRMMVEVTEYYPEDSLYNPEYPFKERIVEYLGDMLYRIALCSTEYGIDCNSSDVWKKMFCGRNAIWHGNSSNQVIIFEGDFNFVVHSHIQIEVNKQTGKAIEDKK